MDRATLKELGFRSREETLAFLKSLWRGQGADCPICGNSLELLHKKAKSSDCDWQCKRCDKVFRTIHLLDELNDATY